VVKLHHSSGNTAKKQQALWPLDVSPQNNHKENFAHDFAAAQFGEAHMPRDKRRHVRQANKS
jgi:hypothetical protein